ncbi:MAG: hypothetical protein ACOCZQ_01605 [Nanoarchaeota archaeon]
MDSPVNSKKMDKQKIIQYIRVHGPSLPTQIASHFGQSSIMVGALLSELARSGEIKVSKVKVGSSPLYYLDEHKHRLQEFADHLNEKDKEAYGLLKHHTVLYDLDLTPLLRVSLRTITDFAVPVRVSTENGEELFWRWYLAPRERVEEKIRGRLGKSEQSPKKADEHKSQLQGPMKKEEHGPDEGPKKQEEYQSNEEPKVKPEEHETKNEQEQPKTENEPKVFNNNKTNRHKEVEQKEGSETQQHLSQEPEDDLHEKIKKHFSDNEIKVDAVKPIRKNQEIDYEIIVPSAIGQLRYFCKAKAKKKLNENDLANAYLAGKRKDLPVLLITTGELTKKAENGMHKEFPGLKVNKIN